MFDNSQFSIEADEPVEYDEYADPDNETCSVCLNIVHADCLEYIETGEGLCPPCTDIHYGDAESVSYQGFLG